MNSSGSGPALHLTVLSLAYSSWSMRPWLVLRHAGADFELRSVELEYMQGQADGTDSLESRRALGSVHGLFPVLRVAGTAIHESLAICEYAAEAFPQANLWPADIVTRAQARAVSAEMHSGFGALRNEMPCHLFARVTRFEPSSNARQDIERIFEIWRGCLDRFGGPFLFGNRFGIADAMYYPVLTRLRTYAIAVPPDLVNYARALETLPAVQRLIETAKDEPRVPIYDDHVRSLGGDPQSALPLK
ncbi:MAG: glutathione S-transferase [Gammaproteobacteria bacterium]|jgi:glutathione S-transferase